MFTPRKSDLPSEYNIVFLVSGSDLYKHCRATHSLDVCSAIIISGSDLLKHWRATHLLDAHLAFLISGSDLLKLLEINSLAGHVYS